jgi:hypothetical protein
MRSGTIAALSLLGLILGLATMVYSLANPPLCPVQIVGQPLASCYTTLGIGAPLAITALSVIGLAWSLSGPKKTSSPTKIVIDMNETLERAVA